MHFEITDWIILGTLFYNCLINLCVFIVSNSNIQRNIDMIHVSVIINLCSIISLTTITERNNVIVEPIYLKRRNKSRILLRNIY